MLDLHRTSFGALNRPSALAALLLALALGAGTAHAQESADELGASNESGSGETGSGETGTGGEISNEEIIDDSGMLSDEQIRAEQRLRDDESVTTVRSGTDPYEDPSSAYLFLGASYFHTFTPAFIIGLFTDENTGGNNPGVALDFTYRKDNFSIIVSAYWQRFAVEGAFRGLGEDLGETEWIDSSLSALALSATLLWSSPLNDYFAFEYGLSVGLGGMLGAINRTEAYPEGDGWAACEGAGNPNATYCEAVDGDYHVDEPNWANGGSSPLIWGRLAPVLGMRIKPIKQLVLRVDGGFDFFSGFFVGAGFGIGLNG